MKMIDYVQKEIDKELKRLRDNDLPITEYDYDLIVEDNGFMTRRYTTKSKYQKLLELKKEILSNDLYKQKNFNKYSFKTFETDKPYQDYMLQKAKAFADKPKGTFVISGQTASGKSHLCTAIVKNLILKGYKTKYVVWQEELDRIKSLPMEDRFREVEYLGNVEVLYLDDFLKTSSNDGQITESDKKVTNNIINMRYVRGLTTIISTELNYYQMADIHASMAGRLLEMTNTENGNYFITVAYKANRNYRERFLPKEL